MTSGQMLQTTLIQFWFCCPEQPWKFEVLEGHRLVLYFRTQQRPAAPGSPSLSISKTLVARLGISSFPPFRASVSLPSTAGFRSFHSYPPLSAASFETPL